MSEQKKREKPSQSPQRARLVFEGIKGRQPKTDQELRDWLASDEGQAAMAFEPASASRWGEVGRS